MIPAFIILSLFFILSLIVIYFLTMKLIDVNDAREQTYEDFESTIEYHKLFKENLESYEAFLSSVMEKDLLYQDPVIVEMLRRTKAFNTLVQSYLINFIEVEEDEN